MRIDPRYTDLLSQASTIKVKESPTTLIKSAEMRKLMNIALSRTLKLAYYKKPHRQKTYNKCEMENE